MINIGDYSVFGSYRIRARVKFYFDESPRGWTWDRCTQHAKDMTNRKPLRGAKPEHQVMACLASPSCDVYIDRLPPVARDNFWRLVEWAKTPEAEVYKELDGVGYIAPHRNKKLNEYIFVVHAGHQNVQHRDQTREMIQLVRVNLDDVEQHLKWSRVRWENAQESKAMGHQTWGVDPNHTYEQHVESELNGFIKQRGYRGRTVYLDRLTKKEKAKLAILKLMPINKYLEGHGGRAQHFANGPSTYILLGDK
jgi:hypothetical protein